MEGGWVQMANVYVRKHVYQAVPSLIDLYVDSNPAQASALAVALQTVEAAYVTWYSQPPRATVPVGRPALQALRIAPLLKEAARPRMLRWMVMHLRRSRTQRRAPRTIALALPPPPFMGPPKGAPIGPRVGPPTTLLVRQNYSTHSMRHVPLLAHRTHADTAQGCQPNVLYTCCRHALAQTVSPLADLCPC